MEAVLPVTSSPAQGLANWLVKNESAIVEYHLIGRVALVGATLFFLAEAIVRIAIASLAFLGHMITCGSWSGAKTFHTEQMEKSYHAGSASIDCFLSILSPKQLADRLGTAKEKEVVKPAPKKEEQRPKEIPVIVEVPKVEEPKVELTPEERNWRVRKGAEEIEARLQTQWKRAQAQATEEPDAKYQKNPNLPFSEFKYLDAPADFATRGPVALDFIGKTDTERTKDYEVGICHCIGRRPTMEDQHLTTTFDLTVGNQIYPVQLFGIFDGHAGGEASLYVKEKLEAQLHQKLEEHCKEGLTDEAIWNALKLTFVQLHYDFPLEEPGTTVTVAMILDGQLWTANVGDSRTILSDGTQLTEDAKPLDPYYRKGIKNRWGLVVNGRIQGVLAVGRAVGDKRLLYGVNPRPKITKMPVPKGRCLILACDGIFDVASTREVAKAVAGHKAGPELIAKNLVYSAYQAGSTDNLSALVVQL